MRKADQKRFVEYAADERRVRRTTVGRREARIIRDRLGLGPDEPFPRCRHRSEKRAEILAQQGEAWHLTEGHWCSRCGCEMIAGSGTAHYGTGRCHIHEKGYTPMENEIASREHKKSLVAREPQMYHDLGKFSALVKAEGELGQERLGLLHETRIARGLLQEMIMKMDGNYRDPVTGEPVGLTEYIEGVKVAMSDATRIKLMTGVLPKVKELVEAEMRMELANEISLSQFQVWFGKVWTGLQAMSRQVDSGEIKTGLEIQECIKNLFREIGEPRKRKG